MTGRSGSIVSRGAARTWHVCAILAAWLVLQALARPCEAGAHGADDVTSDVAAGAEYHYIVSARVRPLLFWIGRDNVGDARIGLRTGIDDTREYELLIGSDPRRAPFGVNRWGYLLERVSSNGLTLVGVMTESDEDSVEEAHTRVSSAKTKTSRFKAIRARVLRGEAEAAVQRAALPDAPTLRDLDAVLAWFPESGMSPRRTSLPDGVSGGFLSATASLLNESVDVYHRTARPVSRLRRVFVHGTSIYEVLLKSTAAVAFHRDAVTERALESQFEVHSPGGDVSRFRVTYGTEGRFSGVPLRVVYRPKWWFEAELMIERAGA